MPGFRIPDRTATLVFEDGDLKGLELTVRLNVPLDYYFELAELASGVVAKQGLEVLRKLLHRFAETALVGWNLVGEDDSPVTLTAEAFTATIDPQSGGAMVKRYLSAVRGDLGPLARSSANGATSGRRRVRSRR